MAVMSITGTPPHNHQHNFDSITQPVHFNFPLGNIKFPLFFNIRSIFWIMDITFQ